MTEPQTPRTNRPARAAGRTLAALLLGGSALAAPGCLVWFDAALGLQHDLGPPPSHYTRLWPQGTTGEPLVGISTEDGIIVLTRPGFKQDDVFDIQFPTGNSVVRDWGWLVRRIDTLAIVEPRTARLLQGRFAASVPAADESLWVSLLGERDEPQMLRARWWRAGEYGDWITIDGADPDDVAGRHSGAGVYVNRDGRWEICGLLSGLVARGAGAVQGEAVGFLGLSELARILPRPDEFYLHDIRVLRPDFEFGVPLQRSDVGSAAAGQGAGGQGAGGGGQDAGGDDDEDEAPAGDGSPR